jgi:hypothetical protein
MSVRCYLNRNPIVSRAIFTVLLFAAALFVTVPKAWRMIARGALRKPITAFMKPLSITGGGVRKQIMPATNSPKPGLTAGTTVTVGGMKTLTAGTLSTIGTITITTMIARSITKN